MLAFKTQDSDHQRYVPFDSGTTCNWNVPPVFVEGQSSIYIGALQSALRKGGIEELRIDLSEVGWADPLPLLQLGCLLAESGIPKCSIKLVLSHSRQPTLSQRIFHKFISQQGFLGSLAAYCQIEYAGELCEDSQRLIIELASDQAQTHLINSDCVLAKVVRVEQFASDTGALQDYVEALLDEAASRATYAAFGAEPLARDILFQKLRKLLFELLLNAAEHSHTASAAVCAGIFARVRTPKPPNLSQSLAWTALFERDIAVPGQNRFAPNPYTEWLELFICDVGVGLTSQIRHWKSPDDPITAKILQRAVRSKNPLESIASQLFRRPFSRFPRHDFNRSTVTGLQHLGHLLNIGGDYCRIYAQSGCWIGNHFPWGEEATYNKLDQRDRAKAMHTECVSGTAYHFSIQPNHYNLAEIRKHWEPPSQACTQLILNALRSIRSFDPPVSAEFYDRRTSNNCRAPSIEELTHETPNVQIVRPPRLTSKQDIASWFELIAGNRWQAPLRPVNLFILTDLSAFQMVTLRELILEIESNENYDVVQSKWTPR